METFAIYSYSAAVIAFGLLLILSLIYIKKGFLVGAFAIASSLSLAWASYTVIVLNNNLYIQDTLFIESLRNLAWFFLLTVLISKQQFDNSLQLLRHSWKMPAIIFFTFCVAILEYYSELRYQLQQYIGFDFRLFAHIFFSIIGLVMVEQFYRNAIPEQRWVIKFFSIGLATIFALDFILYSKSLLFNSLDTTLWEARGIVNALTVPLLGITFHRLTSKETIKIQVSNNLIFHTSVLLGAGLYLLLMSLAGYYIKAYGGSWGAIAQISFIFLAIVLLLVFFVSGKIRALAKVYFSKHFFQHRYDYRDEWVKLSKRIATLDSLNDLSSFIVSTMANCVDSTGGGLWVKNSHDDFYLTFDQNLREHSKTLVSTHDAMIKFLNSKQWVIDFVEYLQDPEIYFDSGIESWASDVDEIWLIIPLFHQNELIAFVVLTQPRVHRQIDWEDHDLLKTIGMQLANALALTQASDDLSRARQFEAYNRFSAFLVHDLKNLVAQISLIVKNAEKHKRNPEFIDDSIETLENVVKKIDHLLSQLKKGNNQTITQLKINLVQVLNEVSIQQAANQPLLNIEVDFDEIWVLGEKEKMVAIFGHLAQNAQEATNDLGKVSILAKKNAETVEIKVIDSGCGMDESFIQQRLFKPFDTTKGNAGMGIGVYEAREYILQQSGVITVESEVGKGTVFTITLPIAR